MSEDRDTGENDRVKPLRAAAVGVSTGRTLYGAALFASGFVLPSCVIDTDAKAAKAWARELKIADTAIFGTLSALFDSETQADIALLALPLALRPKVISAFARQSVPCVVEPPLGETLADCDIAISAAHAANLPLFPLLTRRFDPFVEAIDRLLEDSAIGRVQHIRCDWTLPIAESTVKEISAGGPWHSLLQSVAIHSADLCRLWLGDAFSVSADLDLSKDHTLPQTTSGRRTSETVATLIVNHDGGQATHHFARVHGAQSGERYTLTGTNGELQFVARAGIRQSALAAPSLTLTRNGQRTEEIAVETFGMPTSVLRTAVLLDHAAEVVRGLASTLRVTGEDARAALEIVHAAYSASYEGLKVLLPLKQSPDIAAMFRDPNEPLKIEG